MSDYKFFTNYDFDAFDVEFAESEDKKIIAARQYVAEYRMRALHNDDGSGNGLDHFFRKRGLHAHWQKQHLTNVYWPFAAANAGWVDYLRMGYGKERKLVKELANRTGVFAEITDMGTREAIAFYCVTQLQVGMDYYGWWINLYIDKKGWIEQNNLLHKIGISNKNKSEFINLLRKAQDEGYDLVIQRENYPFEYDDANELINAMQELKANKEAFSVSIEKIHERDAKENNSEILNYLKEEFDKLLPLYYFISWHPDSNNYLGI